jgi:RNA polymerase sigma-70 factor (ECF subfamily)
MQGASVLTIGTDSRGLVQAAAAGDAAAFDALVQQHSAQVFRLALRMLGNRQDAEDVQQETFLRAYRKLHSFRGEAAFGTWLYTIASRLCLSHRRVRRPEEATDIAIAELGDDPRAQFAARELAQRVSHALNALAPADRLLIVLKYVEGLSHEEISRVVGCSAESSRSRLLRAKRLFRQQYGECE